MIILRSENALQNADLSAAYLACKQDVEITARFKKKEDLLQISKSILKHRIQTLTGRNIKQIEEEMKYKPVDPNETGMNFDVLRKLAHCLILLANGELKQTRETILSRPEESLNSSTTTGVSKKRTLSDSDSEVTAPKSKVGRRSIAVVSHASEEHVTPTVKRGRKSIATPLVTEQVSTPNRTSRRSVATTPPRSIRKSGLNDSTSTEASVAVRCLGPSARNEEKLQNLNEADEEEEDEEGWDETISNPTPAMKELMKKRKSIGITKTPSKKAKSVAVKSSPVKAAPPAPRPEFVGTDGSRVFLLHGDLSNLRMERLTKALPLSYHFQGANLSVVHTPSDWNPSQISGMIRGIKMLNKSAGLDMFVILMGTGVLSINENVAAMLRHTQHTQVLTIHNENANKNLETGKLRETTSFFLVGYFFPGCEKEDSKPETKLVRDGYTTSFRCTDVTDIENSIIDCFSERGEYVIDFLGGERKLILTAAEQGRNGMSFGGDLEQLEKMGDFLRTLSLKEDKTYREEDGLVLKL